MTNSFIYDRLSYFQRFVKRHEDLQSKDPSHYEGFWVKTGFTTHGSVYRGRNACMRYEDILQRLKRYALLSNHANIPGHKYTPCLKLPYVMIQPKVKISTEYKVLLLNGEVKAITTSTSGFKSSLTDIFAFCEKVVSRLKENFPELMTEYVIRVDLFEVGGKLKVNEFESFDANILINASHTKRKFDDGSRPFWTDSATIAFLGEFWKAKLQELFSIKVQKIHDVSPNVTSVKKNYALVLGMYFISQGSLSNYNRGKRHIPSQVPRDHVRCQALEREFSMTVYSVDDKHTPDREFDNGRHLCSRFDRKGFVDEVFAKWEGKQFSFIALDYFLSPVGYTRESWDERFYYETLPSFVYKKLLTPDGFIWLPNNADVSDKLTTHFEVLRNVFTIEKIREPLLNPLYLATDSEECKQALAACDTHNTVNNYTSRSNIDAEFPFYRLCPLQDADQQHHDVIIIEGEEEE